MLMGVMRQFLKTSVNVAELSGDLLGSREQF